MRLQLADLSGQRFGKLNVVNEGPRYPRNDRPIGYRTWVCLCDCGNTTTVLQNSLRSGLTKSCGCILKERAKERSINSLYHQPTFKAWRAMKARCSDSNVSGYKNYKGRGITICERWNNYYNFLLDMGDRPENTSLDRIDNDGNYEPGNCRWADRKTQARNTTRSRRVCFNGKTQVLSAWIEELNLNPDRIYYLVHRRKINPEIVLKTIQ